MKDTPMIAGLVAALPEVYQPIIGHPGLSWNASRGSADRLRVISSIHDALRALEGRPLRVLDLGCAQGYFSFSLAAAGALVHGVDFLEPNIALCRALGARLGISATFELARIEEAIERAEDDAYDLVLCLSVLHHLVHEQGVDRVLELLGQLSRKCGSGIFELALRREPVHWAVSQPESARALLAGYACVSEVGRFPTHLSEITRPMYFASNDRWWIDGVAGRFEAWTETSNQFAPHVHNGTRRFFLGEGIIAKRLMIDEPELGPRNLEEWECERAFLAGAPAEFAAPKLIAASRSETEAWLARQTYPGVILSNLFSSTGSAYDPDRVVRDILRELVVLEKAGLYHNDVRTWNVLITPDGGAHLVDFGSISKVRRDCAWPHELLVSFFVFIREVFSASHPSPTPHRLPLLSVERLGPPWREAVQSVLAAPYEDWSFELLQRSLTAPIQSPVATAGFLAIMRAAEEASDHLVHHAASLAGALAFREKEHAELAATLCEAQANLAESRSRLANLQTRSAARESELLANLEAARADAQSQLAERANQLESLRNELETALESARQEVKRSHERMHEMATTWADAAISHNRQLVEQLDAMRRSASWRVTYPLRMFAAFAMSAAGLPPRALGIAVRGIAAGVQNTSPRLFKWLAERALVERVFAPFRAPRTSAESPGSARAGEERAVASSAGPLSSENFPRTETAPQASSALADMIAAAKVWRPSRRRNA